MDHAAIGSAARWAPSGFTYAPRVVRHDRAYQAERLRAADVDPALYGEQAEAGLFGLACFDAMTGAGLDIDGYVFLGQTYRQIMPVALGTSLTLGGHVRRLHAVRRGIVAQEIYFLHDQTGRLCLETALTGLLADPPGGFGAGRPEAPPLPRRIALPEDGWVQVAEKQITPDKVRAFSQDVGNEIHFDVDLARHHGFRAPLAQGIMSAVWLMSALAAAAPPARFNVRVRYLRPVFWDARATLWTRSGPDGGIAMVQSRDEAGRDRKSVV